MQAEHAPSKSTLWVPPSMKARLHTPLGGSVQYPICMANLDVAPSAMTSILPFTCFPCKEFTCCQSVLCKWMEPATLHRRSFLPFCLCARSYLSFDGMKCKLSDDRRKTAPPMTSLSKAPSPYQEQGSPCQPQSPPGGLHRCLVPSTRCACLNWCA